MKAIQAPQLSGHSETADSQIPWTTWPSLWIFKACGRGLPKSRHLSHRKTSVSNSHLLTLEGSPSFEALDVEETNLFHDALPWTYATYATESRCHLSIASTSWNTVTAQSSIETSGKPINFRAFTVPDCQNDLYILYILFSSQTTPCIL